MKPPQTGRSPAIAAAAPRAASAGPATIATLPWCAALLCLLVAASASALLALEHISGLRLPGCGPGSGCAAAAASPWGKLPLVGWPMSFLGFAFFVSLLLVWIGSRRQPTIAAVVLARAGAAVSLLYAAVMFFGGYFCPYCIAAHLANLLFWVIAESSVRSARRAWTPLIAFSGSMLVLSVVLGFVLWREQGKAAEDAQRAASESTREIIAATTQKAATQATLAIPTAVVASQSASAPSEPFTGRYLLGPPRAPIRIVVCSDYQCPACRNVEEELHQLVTGRDDVSLTMKHFPVCTACNPHIQKTMHANACWAARAAEAAGLLRGNDGFWQMHQELFERKGAFTNTELRDMLTGLGYEPAAFEPVLKSTETLDLVKQDIDELWGIGMRYTPMVLINGVEFRGWETRGAITRAVEKLAATNPPPMGPEHDWPLPAAERFLIAWREEPPRAMPLSDTSWRLGPADAKVQVLLFGDYSEPTVARADRVIRDWAAAHESVAYFYQHFPANKDCNPAMTFTSHERGCWAAKAAEAAGQLRGNEAFWRMHAWLMENQGGLNDAGLQAFAPRLDIDYDVLKAGMDSPQVSQAIAEQSRAAKGLGLSSIPWIYVNGKFVSTWEFEGEVLLEQILTEAAAPAP